MSAQLLPATAKAFQPRASVSVILGLEVDGWLTETLTRINEIRKTKTPMNSSKHQNCLAKLLSNERAIWTLATLELATPTIAHLRQDEEFLPWIRPSHQTFPLEAYIIYVDMVQDHKVAYKLTPDTIKSLIKHHRGVCHLDRMAATCDGPEISHVEKLHYVFVQAIHEFVFRSDVSALKGLKEGGAGDLPDDESARARNAILALVTELTPHALPEAVQIGCGLTQLPSQPLG
ncbi:hypothetical protein Micbo1qcDRAFT_105675, partial [Microdochium bolleyi]